jgi:hypothetical protein
VSDDTADEQLSAPVSRRSDLLELGADDRRRLAAWLFELNAPGPVSPTARRRRRNGLLLAATAAGFLVPWAAFLAATLPEQHRADDWNIAWVGYDVGLILAFAATAWFGWRSRQLVITACLVTATLLLCDAWFDLTLSWGSTEEAASIFTAAVAEVPIAVYLLTIYHRLLRSVTWQIWKDRGKGGEPPPLRSVPLLLGGEPAHHVPLHGRR